MSRLLLVAASGLAREVLAVERVMRRFTRIRVLDDDPSRWGDHIDGEPIVGGLELAAKFDDHRILVCAGSGIARRSIVARLDELGVDQARYLTLVHPSVQIPESCTLGTGSIMLAGTVLTASVRIGEHVVVMPNATLTHDDVLEDFATISAGVSLGGGVHVGTGAYVGMNACVRQNTQVGADATLGMGAALIEDLPSGETWVGVPARPAGSRVVRRVS
jgi:sugar O-acyltransferase (sialic acid O-acetyltransferase NeuD family)